MNVLAIETSSPRASLALWKDGVLACEEHFESDRAHNAVIFEPLQRALLECKARELDRIAVGIGPGSYSGVRIGIAIANALAIAGGGTTIGLSSLEAFPSETEDYFVVGDARRQTFFLANILGRELQGEPELLDRETFLQKLDAIPETTPIFTGDASLTEWTRAQASAPAASVLAERAGSIEVDRISSAPMEPHYLRAPFITKPKGS